MKNPDKAMQSVYKKNAKLMNSIRTDIVNCAKDVLKGKTIEDGNELSLLVAQALSTSLEDNDDQIESEAFRESFASELGQLFVEQVQLDLADKKLDNVSKEVE